MKNIAILIVFALTGCVVAPPARVVYVSRPAAPAVYQPAPPPPVVSVYIDPPLVQPLPILLEWAPPPMLVERIVPIPYDGAIWTGGYWVWEGNWVWAHGRWSAPPQPGYGWINPYYENRGGSVVFVNGFWAAPGVSFVAPSFSASIALGAVAIGVVAGPRVIGAPGVFIPAPPGSQPGLVVAAPIGIAPAVVTSAPPVLRPGMRIEGNNNNITRNSTTVNNVINVSNVTTINNVTIVAPAGTTATGQAYAKSVPASAHLAAALPPMVRSFAPEPVSTKAIPAYVPGRQPAALPPVQAVHTETTALTHPRTFADLARPAAQPGAPSAASSMSPTSAAAPVALPAALSAQSVKPPQTTPPSPTPVLASPSASTKAPQVTGAVASTPQGADPRASRTTPPIPAEPSPAANMNRQIKPQDNAAMKRKEQKPHVAMHQPSEGRPKAAERHERE